MPLVRASSLDQFLECSAWVGQVTADDKAQCDAEFERAEDAKNWGTMVHTWIETGKIRHPQRVSTDKVIKEFALREERLFENRVVKHKLTPRGLYPIEGLHEVAMAYNWRLGTSVVAFQGTPEYKNWYKLSFGDDWVTGSCDFFLEQMFGSGSVNDMVWIDDLKTGKWWTKKAKESAQIKFYALCLAQHCDRIPVRGVQITVTHWPKYPANRPPVREPEFITLSELTEFEIELREKCALAVGEVKSYRPSAQTCRFCPFRFNCLFRVEPEVFDWRAGIK